MHWSEKSGVLHFLKLCIHREPQVEDAVNLYFHFRRDALAHPLDGDGQRRDFAQPPNDGQSLVLPVNTP